MNKVYDRVIGYSSLDLVEQSKLRRLVELNHELIGRYLAPEAASPILVAGAGRGDEAGHVRDVFGCRTIGVDLHVDRLPRGPTPVELSLQRQDLHDLGFRDSSFGLVYCYHVLEHVSRPSEVLQEFSRVLKPNGMLFIGFPNKRRVVSYVGTSQRATILDKLKWNINDYGFRLRGEFTNEAGAHAGYAPEEFLAIAGSRFSSITSVTNQYMMLKYPRLGGVLKVLIRSRLSEIAFPSHYYLCGMRTAP